MMNDDDVMQDVPGDVPDAPPQDAPAASGPWDSLSDEDKGYVANKGWQGSEDMLQSYRSLERLHGVAPEKVLRLPDDPSQMGEVWDKLGRPADPKSYEVDLPEEYRDGVYDQMSAKAHELGLTQDQWRAMTAAYQEIGEGLNAEADQAMTESLSNYQAQHPVETQNVKRLLAAVGADEATVQSALTGDVNALYDTLAKVSSKMGELPAITGETASGFGGMTPEQARVKRDQLYGDPQFMERLKHADQRVRATANAELEPLTRAIVDARSAPGSDEIERLRQENARLMAQVRRG